MPSDRAALPDAAPLTRATRPDEATLVARLQRALGPAPDWLVVDIGDDAAVYEPPRNRLEVITTDAVVDGVHCDRRFVAPAAIGHRAVAVNLSDLAAMGATPRLLTLSLALPVDFALDEFDALIDGALETATRHNARLVGGNLTRTPGPLSVDVTAVGHVHRRRILRRSGARAGDGIFVSGWPGSARAGLDALRQDGPAARDAWPSLTARYLLPEPRVALGRTLAASGVVTSAIDLSDGLADGLRRLTTAHSLGCLVEAGRLPTSDEARRFWTERSRSPTDETIEGGDDYELLFTVRPNGIRRLAAATRHLTDLPLTRIGSVTREHGCWLVETGGGRTPITGGFDHFSR
jgi:thiamine-monophosphate kinase